MATLLISQFRCLQHFMFNYHFLLNKSQNVLIYRYIFPRLLNLRLESISFIFSLDDFFSFRSALLVFSHPKLRSISSSWLDSSDLLLLQVACRVGDTEHQLNQQHHLNHWSYFQWLMVQTISGCTSRKRCYNSTTPHFVCQNQRFSIAYTNLFYFCCNIFSCKNRLSMKSWLIFW